MLMEWTRSTNQVLQRLRTFLDRAVLFKGKASAWVASASFKIIIRLSFVPGKLSWHWATGKLRAPGPSDGNLRSTGERRTTFPFGTSAWVAPGSLKKGSSGDRLFLTHCRGIWRLTSREQRDRMMEMCQWKREYVFRLDVLATSVVPTYLRFQWENESTKLFFLQIVQWRVPLVKIVGQVPPD